MKKFKLMLMFCALVSLTGSAPAEVTLVDWDYLQDPGGTVSSLSDIIVQSTLVGGVASDPNLVLTATLPAPVFTQHETGVTTLPGTAIGYAIADPNAWGGDPNNICGGFSVQWSGSTLYSGTVNYDGGPAEVWALPLPLKLHTNNRKEPLRSTQYFWEVDIFDEAGTYDFVGKFRIASMWGEVCHGDQHNGNQYDWRADPNSAFEDHDGYHDGNNVEGDDLGFRFFRRQGAEPEGSGVIFVAELYIGGTLFVDMSELGLLPCPAFARDAADLDKNCIVDFRDFALLAAEWQNCGWDYDCPALRAEQLS